MNKRIWIECVILFFLTSFSLKAQTASESKKPEMNTMYVKGRYLYTAANEKVILRGVNEMMIWLPDKTGSNGILAEIAKTGANSMRLVWNTTGSPEDLNLLIGNCLKNNMIPIVELHDATGDWSKLPSVIAYWKKPEIKKVILNYEKWILLNIANEVGAGNTPDSVFISNYKNAIQELRKAGYTVPLIIDAPDWGKDETMILRTWKELRDSDPIKNCMFSVHTYWVDSDAIARMDKFLAQVVKETIPFLFGEGPQSVGWDCKTEFPYLYCMEQTQKLEIGWLTWSWGGLKNGDCTDKRAHDMTTDGKYGNWNNDWGRLVVVDDKNSIKKTSIRPKSLLMYK